MAKDLIPESIDLTKVKLTPKGFVYLVLAFAVVIIAVELAKWVVNKVKNGAKAIQPEEKPAQPVMTGRRGI